MERKITWLSSHELFPTVQKRINSVNSVLDVGCGIRPQYLANTFVHVCVDAHKQYLDVVKANNKSLSLKDQLRYFYFNITSSKIISKFPRRSVDSVFFLDVIEHLEKKHALELLKAFSEIAKHQIIIFTPLGFVKQEHPDGKDAWGLDGGKWQEHRSGWLPEDFDETWDIFACKDFHVTDNIGELHAAPVGAFFAIKTLSPVDSLIFDKSLFKKVLFYLKFRSKMASFQNTL